MVIHIIGLGPGRASLITVQAAELLRSGLAVLLRTRHHPAVEELDPDALMLDCDDLYHGGGSFDATYDAVVLRVLELGRAGGVVYALPGNPLVAEATVPRLLSAAHEEGVEARIYPAVSYLDLAALAVGLDLGNVQVCDALDLRVDTWRPAVIAQLHSRDIATSVKLHLLDLYPAAHEVTLLHALGTDGEQTRELPLSELDHQPFGHLDSLFVPPLERLADLRRFDGVAAIIERLHAPGGCPWDREQTHASLRPHLLEECYEALEAIEAGDPAALAEELGDLLLQVLMHAAVARREGEFTFGDVTALIGDKLIRRHPHVFGAAEAASAEDVHRNWEVLKKAENPRRSALDGVPSTMPALAASQAIQGRARRLGFDWPDIEGPLEKLAEEVGEFARSSGTTEREDEFGDILFVLANIGQRLGVDAEQALRRANAKFKRRFGAVERLAEARNVALASLDLAGLDALWDEAKAAGG